MWRYFSTNDNHFHDKIACPIKDLAVPDSLCIVTQEKSGMDERLIMAWYEDIWKLIKWHERTKEIDSHKSLMVVDVFKAHFKDDVAAKLIGHTGVVKVSTGLLRRMYQQTLQIYPKGMLGRSRC